MSNKSPEPYRLQQVCLQSPEFNRERTVMLLLSCGTDSLCPAVVFPSSAGPFVHQANVPPMTHYLEFSHSRDWTNREDKAITACKEDITPSQAWKESKVNEATTGITNCTRNHLNFFFFKFCFVFQVLTFHATLIGTAPFPRQCYKWALLICLELAQSIFTLASPFFWSL